MTNDINATHLVTYLVYNSLAANETGAIMDQMLDVSFIYKYLFTSFNHFRSTVWLIFSS